MSDAERHLLRRIRDGLGIRVVLLEGGGHLLAGNPSMRVTAEELPVLGRLIYDPSGAAGVALHEPD